MPSGRLLGHTDSLWSLRPLGGGSCGFPGVLVAPRESMGMPSKRLADVLADDSGFTWMELLIASAILALLVAVMLPSYLGARNAAAIAEGNAMAKEWAALEYSCYQQNTFPSLVTTTGINCFTNTAIGFTEPNGKFWRFTTGTGTSPYIQSASTTASGLGQAMVSFPSTNAGLENGETFTVTVFLTGSTRDTVTMTCIPKAC